MIKLILFLFVPTSWCAPQFLQDEDVCQVTGCQVSHLSLDSALSTFLCYTKEEYGAMGELEKKIKLAEKIVSKFLSEDGFKVQVDDLIEMDSDDLVGLTNLILHTGDSEAGDLGRKTEEQFLSEVIDGLVQKTNFSFHLFEEADPHFIALLNCEIQNNRDPDREGRGAFLNTVLERLFLTVTTSTPVTTAAPTSTAASTVVLTTGTTSTPVTTAASTSTAAPTTKAASTTMAASITTMAPMEAACRDVNVCPANWAPVCGENDITYGNNCTACGVKVVCDGECPCKGIVCKNVCPEIWSPVCGADDITYSNNCTACGVQIVCDGECPCNGIVCKGFCTRIWAPVCGVDNITYSNNCTACGVQIVCNGECPCKADGKCDPTSNPTLNENMETSTPFSGTVHDLPNISTSPEYETKLKNVSYVGQEERTMWDYRVGDWIQVEAFVFTSAFSDNMEVPLEVKVNPEFGTEDNAQEQAMRYSGILGEIPLDFRARLEILDLNKGRWRKRRRKLSEKEYELKYWCWRRND